MARAVKAPEELRGFFETYRFGGWDGDAQGPSPALAGGSKRPVYDPSASPRSPAGGGLPPTPIYEFDTPQGSSAAQAPVAPAIRRASLPVEPAVELDPGPALTPLNVSTSAIPLTLEPPPTLPRTASELYEFYKANRYVPAPVPPRETLSRRVRAVTRLNVLSPSRRQAIRRICRIARAYFDEPDDTIILTILDGAKQIVLTEQGDALNGVGVRLAGEAGADKDDPGPRIMDVDLGFCAHGLANAVTTDPSTGRSVRGNPTFIVRDANTDWRFAGNPLTSQNGGRVHFYAGSSIYAKRGSDDPASASSSGSASNAPGTASEKRSSEAESDDMVPVGSLCLIHPRARRFTAKDQSVLEELAGMLQREFELAFEAERREKESRMRDWISGFIGESVLPMKAQLASATSVPMTESPPTAGRAPEGEPRATSPSTSSAAHERGFREHLTSRRRSSETGRPQVADGPSLFLEAAQQTRRLLGADSAAIADLRSLRPYLYRDGTTAKYSVNPDRAGAAFYSSASGAAAQQGATGSHQKPGWTPTMGSDGAEGGAPIAASHALSILGESHCDEWIAGLAATGESAPVFLEQTVVDFLNEYARTGQVIWDRDDATSPATTGPDDGQGALDQEVDPFELAARPAAGGAASQKAAQEAARAQRLGPLWPLMPSDTTAYAAVPFSDHEGEPCLLLIVHSRQPFFRFEDGDRVFLASVGAVCISALMKQRVLEADAAKLSFVSRVSHELRTPLWAIQSQLDMIRLTLPPDALSKIDSLLQIAEACGDTLSTLLEDVLALGKFSQNTDVVVLEAQTKQPLRKADLEALMMEVAIVSWKTRQRMDIAEMYATSAEAGTGSEKDGAGQPLRIFVEVDERSEGWDAMVDVAGLKRILFNLVGNSLKFTRQGKVVLSIRELPTTTNLTTAGEVSEDPSAVPTPVRWVEFCVLDTGCGMEEDWIKNDLFTAFKQKNPFSVGAGLGMSICNSLVRRMSGKIQVASRVGVGTSIRVTLPLELCDLPPTPPKLPRAVRRMDASAPGASLPPPKPDVEGGLRRLAIAPQPARPAPSSSSPVRSTGSYDPPSPDTSPAASAVFSSASKATTPATPPLASSAKEFLVLVIDDNPISRTTMTALLKKKGVPHMSAVDGYDGLAKYKQHLPALIWLDQEMPGLSGTEVTELIRAHEEANKLPRAQIVVLSGQSAEEDMRNGFKSGADDWVIKGSVPLRTLGERVDVLRGATPSA